MKQKGINTTQDLFNKYSITYANGMGLPEAAYDPLLTTYAYAGINRIAESVASCPFILHNDNGVVEQGTIYDTFTNPNQLMDISFFMKLSVMYYLGYGEVFILKHKIGNEVTALWPYSPTYFREVIGKNGLIEGWEFTSQNGLTSLSLNEVIHIKRPNPSNPYRGLSILTPVSDRIASEKMGAIYQHSLLRNNAVPAGIIQVDGNLTTSDKERLKSQWEDTHGSPSKGGKVAVLGKGMNFVPLSYSATDAQLLETRNSDRDAILGVLGVPKFLISADSEVNYATATAGVKLFWNNTIIPILRSFEESFRTNIFKPDYKEAIWGEFDLSQIEALRENFSDKLDQAQKLKDLGYSLEEINIRLNLGMSVKVEKQVTTHNVKIDIKDKIKRYIYEFRTKLLKDITSLPTLIDELSSNIDKLKIDNIIGNQLSLKVDKPFKDLPKSLKKSILAIIDRRIEGEETPYESTFYPLRQYQGSLTMKSGYVFSGNKICGVKDLAMYNEIKESIKHILNDYTAKLPTIINTELTNVINTAIYSSLPIGTGIKWMSNNCHTHLDGTEVLVGNTFPNGQSYPGDLSIPEESINCTCKLGVMK